MGIRCIRADRYSFGPATTITYVYFLSVFVSMFVEMYINRDIIHKRRRSAVSIWFAIWLVAALWQFLDSSVLIASFGGGLGVLIIFSMIKNPELSLDKESSSLDDFGTGQSNLDYMASMPVL